HRNRTWLKLGKTHGLRPAAQRRRRRSAAPRREDISRCIYAALAFMAPRPDVALQHQRDCDALEEEPMARAEPDGLPQDLVSAARDAVVAAESLLADATLAVRDAVTRDGELSALAMDCEQRATHGLAWLATYVEAVRQLAAFAERMEGAGRF